MAIESKYQGPICTICREEWPNEGSEVELPPGLKPTALKCGHVFHESCKKLYFNASTQRILKCPLCRSVEGINPNAPSAPGATLSAQTTASTQLGMEAMLNSFLHNFQQQNNNFIQTARAHLNELEGETGALHPRPRLLQRIPIIARIRIIAGICLAAVKTLFAMYSNRE